MQAAPRADSVSLSRGVPDPGSARCARRRPRGAGARRQAARRSRAAARARRPARRRRPDRAGAVGRGRARAARRTRCRSTSRGCARRSATAPRSRPRAAGYELRVEPGQLDAQRFEAGLADGRAELAAGRPEAAAAALEARWRSGAGRRWASSRTCRSPSASARGWRSCGPRRCEQLVEARLALGRHAEVAGQLDALIAEHPYRERLRAQLMLALYRCDRQADALQAYQDARRALVDELGIEPGERLRELERAILAQDPALAAPRRAAAAAGAGAARRRGAGPGRPERRLVSVLCAGVAAGRELDPEVARRAAGAPRRGDRAPRRQRRERRRRRRGRRVRARASCTRTTRCAPSAPRDELHDGGRSGLRLGIESRRGVRRRRRPAGERRRVRPRRRAAGRRRAGRDRARRARCGRCCATPERPRRSPFVDREREMARAAGRVRRGARRARLPAGERDRARRDRQVAARARARRRASTRRS